MPLGLSASVNGAEKLSAEELDFELILEKMNPFSSLFVSTALMTSLLRWSSEPEMRVNYDIEGLGKMFFFI